MVGQPLTWRRLLTPRTLPKISAAEIILGGEHDRVFAVPRRSMPYFRMEIRAGTHHRRSHAGNREDSRAGRWLLVATRGSPICVGVTPDAILAWVCRIRGSEAAAALAAAVIAAAAVLALCEHNREVH